MEKIEKYLKDQVSEEERVELNKQLVDDDEFRKLFDEMESLLDGIKRSAEKTSIEEKLQNLDETLELFDEEERREVILKEEQKPIIVLWYNQPLYRAIAASVLVLIVAVYTIGPFGTVSDEKLFAQNFTPYENTTGTRGDIKEETKLEQAFAAYDREDYYDAIILFESIDNTQPGIVNQFYLGNAYLAINEGSKAATLFEEVANAGIGLAMAAKWYLALSYLEMGDREKARGGFMEIVETESDYSKEAQDILNKMKK